MYKIWKSADNSAPIAVKKVLHGIIIRENHMVQKSLIDDIINALDGFEPGLITNSTNWRNWIAELDLRTCKYCRKMHGMVYSSTEIIYDEPTVHDNCRCEIKQMLAIFAGYATRNGLDGADYWVKQYQQLPEYYISKEEAIALGWVSFLGNLADTAPDMMIGGDVYSNRNGHLPEAEGRIWYEADINYTDGYRTRHRILYSNDGLIFVTYDHYQTFIEII